MKKAVILILSFLVMLIFNGCGGGGGGNEKTANPVVTPDSGSYKNSVSVSLSCSTEGANIWYTKDGTDPKTGNAVLYTGTIILAESTTLKVYAVKDGYDPSDIVEKNYTILGTVAKPILPLTGAYAAPFNFTIPVVSGTKVKYTLDGTTPTEVNGIEITTDKIITLNAGSITTVKAVAYKDGWNNSAVAEAV